MRRLKIGIRTQLIILVGFSSLFSLFILAVVSGVYFNMNLVQLRSERLGVIAKLKARQVSQAIDFLYYQVSPLSTRDAITDPLSSIRAGNSSSDVFKGARQSIEQVIWSSEMFAAARLYDLDLTVVAEAYNEDNNVSAPVLDFLFPLDKNSTIPEVLFQQEAFYSGPIANSSNPFGSYFMGITLPILSNTSILMDTPSLSGYLTVIASAANIQGAVNDSRSIVSSNDGKDYSVVAAKPVYNNPDNSSSPIVGFNVVFPTREGEYVPETFYNINMSTSVKQSFQKSSGTADDKLADTKTKVSIGYDRVHLNSQEFWTIIVEQERSKFLQPMHKFTKMIIGVVIGIGAFMCLLTFPLTVWFVRPITKLKDATEAITKSKKKEKDSQNSGKPSSPPPPYNNPSDDKRNSYLSKGSSSSVGYTTGIRLPSRIPRSKALFKDEITELTEAFNIMTDELDKQYTHLEDRVKSRTKELEASKVEAEAANEAKTVFIANISHELRTPLNGILGMTSIAMDEDDNSRIHDSLRLIHRSGELLLHILTELLTYSKNTLSRSKLEKSNFQILEIVYQIKSIFSKLAIDQRVNFKITIKPSIIRKLILYGDSNRIIQIIMNLVSNSLKFTPVNGTVDVKFRLVGEYDFERSKTSSFEKICIVKPSTGKKGDDIDEKVIDDVDNDEGSNGKFDNFPSARRNSAISVVEKDNVSIATLQSKEFERLLFESQFVGKPLPNLPKLGYLENANESPESPNPSENEWHDVVNTDSPDSGDSYSHGSVRKGTRKGSEETDERNESRSDSTPTEDVFDENEKLKVDTNNGNDVSSKALHLRNTSASSLTSITENELIKNEKSYKMRRMYNQKTWVLQIEVTDTGPGIEPALQKKVFEPFVQGDQTLSRSYGGTGLGLSICRQLAKMMHGTLSLKSTLGVGSKFTFTVPLPQTGEVIVPDEDMADFGDDEFNPNSKLSRKVNFRDQEESITEVEAEGEMANPSISVVGTDDEAAREETDYFTQEFGSKIPTSPISEKAPDGKKAKLLAVPENKPQLATRSSTGTASSTSKLSEGENRLMENLSHIKLLVAEDNMVNQEVIKRMLKLEGFEDVTMACNGAEAIDFLKESMEKNEVFDLIFMDVQMPKVDGLLATKMIRNNLEYTNPIIALTAFADESNVKECLSSGMSGFLSKPIKRTNVRKIITEFAPMLLKEVVTTPSAHVRDDKQLGHGISAS